MPATFISEEQFPAGTTEDQMQEAQRLRIQAGAIRSWHEGGEQAGWTLFTEWNVLGEQ